MTLREWCGAWLEQDEAPAVSKSTFDAHRYLLRNHILPVLGDMEMEELNREKIKEFQEDRESNGNSRGGKPLSENAVRNIMTLLRKILTAAAEDGLIAINPMGNWKISHVKSVKGDTLSKSESIDFLDAANELDCGGMFKLMIRYGLRQSEVRDLRWSDVHVKKHSLTIHKKGIVREIRLSSEDMVLLEKEHEKHPSCEILFVHPGTLRPYSQKMLRLRHKMILNIAGIGPIRFEDLYRRRETGKRIRESGAEETALEQRKVAKTLDGLLGF